MRMILFFTFFLILLSSACQSFTKSGIPVTSVPSPPPTLQQTVTAGNKIISSTLVITSPQVVITPEATNLAQATSIATSTEDEFELKDEQTFKSYTVHIYQKKFSEVGYFEIFRNSEQIYRQEGYTFDVGHGPGTEAYDYLVSIGTDITGNGVPNLVISEWTGGQCCYYFYIFEMGQTFKKIDTINATFGAAAHFVNLDGDANLEFEMADWTFVDMPYCFACIPTPKIILRFQDGKYRVADDLMRTSAPSQKELQDKIKQIQNEPEWQGEFPPASLWETMADLIYTGHAELAMQFYEDVWPPTVAGKDKFLDEFNTEFAKSPYWDDIQRINN